MRPRPGQGPGPRGSGWRAALLLAALAWGASGCGWVVTQAAYEKDKEQTQGQLQVIRKQLLAHTQILANHGKSINEVRLQLRDALSAAKKPEGEAKPMEGPAPAVAKAAPPPEAGFPRGKSMFIRSVYEGLPLNYAGGYHAPRGARYPYKLAPGTQVEVLSGDDRGFTHVEVKSGQWRGRKMWVRTRWLVERPEAPGRPRGQG